MSATNGVYFVHTSRMMLMDRKYRLKGMDFIWHVEKNRRNARDHHGVTFEQAAEAFFDPFMRVRDASRHDETRDALVGRDNQSSLLVVVHMEIEGDTVRILPAWPADRSDIAFYNEGDSNP
jgi:uncharacterized DUF497 family protein